MSIVNLIPDEHADRLRHWTDVTASQPTEVFARTAWLGLGSNLGDRAAMLRRAVEAIRAIPGVTVDRCSDVFETEPWGYAEQGPFLNCAVAVRTTLLPETLLDALLAAERALGRNRGPGREHGERNGPRAIDIDILLFGMEVVDRPGLTIPHPFLAERNFVLQPLRQLAAAVSHPVLGATIEELATHCPDTCAAVQTDIHIC